jgi:hypothetical protein
MSAYKSDVPCECGKIATRDYENDLRFGVYNGPKTLGKLAEENTSKMSAAQRKRLYDKHNAYKPQFSPSEDSRDFYENRSKSIGTQEQHKKGNPNGKRNKAKRK